MIAVLHAYSRANAGDGLLVDLTLQRLARLGVTADDAVVVALDPESFVDLPHVVGAGTAGRAADADTAKAALQAVTIAATAVSRRAATGATARALADADAYVAVGGGYLRTGTRVNAAGTALNHLPQLAAAARSRRPTVYLPQSIGPLAGPVGAAVRRALGRITQVHVRDDRSAAELGGAAATNVHRTPDLAVLEVADRLDDVRPQSATGSPVIVARALGAAAGYPERLHELARQLGDVRWAVQTEGTAAKSDRTFYDDLGVPPAGRVGDTLATAAAPVVSVRLHGALQSILAGVPAIHLGYERKSWGAYEDLGLADWVHSARRFDPDVVAAQVRRLRTDPEPYWAAIRAAAPALAAASRRLDADLTRVLPSAVPPDVR